MAEQARRAASRLLVKVGGMVLAVGSGAVPRAAFASEAFQEQVDTWFPSREDPFPPPPQKNKRPLAYSVELTDPPSMLPRTTAGEASAVSKLASMKVVLLGCHLYTPTTLSLYSKNATAPTAQYSDVALVVSLVRRMAKSNPNLVIGVDNVAATTKSAEILKRFLEEGRGGGEEIEATLASLSSEGLLVNSLQAAASNTAAAPPRAADTDMLRALLPVARELGLAVRPLALPPAVQKTLLTEGLDGIQGGMGELLPDPEGFVASVQGEGFSRYTNSVVKQDYSAVIAAAGGSKVPVSGEKYFSNRILLDETLASRVVGSVRGGQQGSGPLLVVTDLSRVRFGYGLVERIKRLLLLPTTTTSSETTALVTAVPDSADVVSLLLNPTAEDSLSLSNQLRLSLGYGVFLPASRPLADYVWFTSSPPSRVITKAKNSIIREGDRPAGESSVLGAF